MLRPAHPRALAALTTALLALLSMAGPGAAGTDADPEITDGTGDVYPAAVMVQLGDPADAANVPSRAELYDLVKAYVAGEGSDMFHLQIHVADIEDDWILPEAAADGQQLLTLDVNGTMIDWDAETLNDKVNLTSNFTIDGRTYRVMAVLAEIDIDNPSRPVHADSAAEVDAMLTVAQAKLDEAYAAVSGVTGLPFIQNELYNLVGSAQAAIDDAQQTLDDRIEWPTSIGEADRRYRATAYPLARAFADEVFLQLDEAQTHMDAARDLVQEQSVPMPAGNEEMDDAVAAAQASLEGAREVFKTLPQVAAVTDGDGNAETPAPARVVLFHRFWLEDADGRRTALSGSVNQTHNYVRIAVPKAAVGSPTRGDVLADFYVTSSLQGHIMDFAPDATNPNLPGDPGALLSGGSDGALVTPSFGRAFTFQYPDASSAPRTNALAISSTGPTSLHAQPGEAARYTFTVRNLGSTAISGTLSLSNPASGWTHSLDADRFDLTAGASQSFALTVMPMGGASDEHASTVTASLEGGASKTLEFRTLYQEWAAPDQSGGDESPQGKDTRKNTPGPGALVALAGIAAAVAVSVRRRRA